MDVLSVESPLFKLSSRVEGVITDSGTGSPYTRSQSVVSVALKPDSEVKVVLRPEYPQLPRGRGGRQVTVCELV
jgi:hypothetical protein